MTTAGDAQVPASRTGAAPRELAIIAAFVALVGIAIATVLVPALRDDAHDEDEHATRPAAAATAGGGGGLAPRPSAPRPGPGAVPAPPTAPVGP